ncbi:MAG: NADH:flavin oxidoreductase [Bacillota bacterium]
MSDSTLYQPLLLGSTKLKNRMVFAPITTGYGTPEGQVTPALTGYYARRAQGGVGTIIVEATSVDPKAKVAPNSLGIWDDDFLPGLSRLVEAAKGKDVTTILQICHAGPQARSKVNGTQPVSPSEIPFVMSDPPRAMTVSDIKYAIDAFVDGARRAQKAGFDGVELHTAHFFLLSAFLSPVTNARKDDYGGSLEGRTRIVREIIAGIKQEAGENFPVICRINGNEAGERGIDLAEAQNIARMLTEAGADSIHVSSYSIPLPGLEKYVAVAATGLPGETDEEGVFIPLAAGIKQAVEKPVIAVGKIIKREMAESIVDEGKADLVAIGRGLIADPDLPNKFIAGDEHVRCLACRTCINTQAKGRMICKQNKDLPGWEQQPGE